VRSGRDEGNCCGDDDADQASDDGKDEVGSAADCSEPQGRVAEEKDQLGDEGAKSEADEGPVVNVDGQVEDDEAVEQAVEAVEVTESAMLGLSQILQPIEDLGPDVTLSQFPVVGEGEGEEAAGRPRDLCEGYEGEDTPNGEENIARSILLAKLLLRRHLMPLDI